MGEAATASAASLRRLQLLHRGVVGSRTSRTAAVGMANGQKVCAGFAKLSPAGWRERGELVVPGTAHPSPDVAKGPSVPRGHINGVQWCQREAVPSSCPTVPSFPGRISGVVWPEAGDPEVWCPGRATAVSLSSSSSCRAAHPPWASLLREHRVCGIPPALWAERAISWPGRVVRSLVTKGSSDSCEASGSARENLQVLTPACGRPGSGGYVSKLGKD